MKISVIGSTCSSKDEAVKFAGRAAGVCYMPSNFESLASEPEERTFARAKGTLISGHHSVYDHITYNLLLEDIPKILAMVLNNEGFYTTSEKSARYTKMNMDENDIELYTKWLSRFKKLINDRYGDKFRAFYVDPTKAQRSIDKLAMENARYMISVFTPTTMVYTVSLRQLNYILGFFKFYWRNACDAFSGTLCHYMLEFEHALPEELKLTGLNADCKSRRLSLFRTIPKEEDYFGEVYSISYLGSWAQLAQAQRHRTLSYQVEMLKEPLFYVPDILYDDSSLVGEWKSDISSSKIFYPQGQMVRIYERGTYDKFLLKCYERICGCAQLEIMKQTRDTLSQYHKCRPDLIPTVFFRGARCTFPNFKCNNPCVWGGLNAITRKI